MERKVRNKSLIGIIRGEKGREFSRTDPCKVELKRISYYILNIFPE